MSVSMKSKGFTLVEMLVVIAIIAILAASLFPKIKDAMNSARATSLMTKGRGIYNAVITANAAREPHGLPSVWPSDVKDGVDGFSVGSVSYFTYLMSDDETIGTIAKEGQRIAADISPDSLSANGTKAYVSGALQDDHCAWRVCEVGDNASSSIPFLITKNFQKDEIKFSGDSDRGKLELTDKKPFGNTLAVWITVGGSAQKAEPIYLTNKIVMGNNETNITVWACN